MESGETVSGFYQKLKSSLSAFEEFHGRCENDPAQRMDDESHRTIKFIYGLSNAYAAFKGYFENKLLAFPESLDAAFTEASTDKTNRAKGNRKHRRSNIFVTSGKVLYTVRYQQDTDVDIPPYQDTESCTTPKHEYYFRS